MRISTVIRAMRPIDLLLPAGAALVSAGLHNLAQREQRHREQLAELGSLVAEHRGALAAAGVPIPGELATDEKHPLDVPTPWDVMGVHLADEPDNRADKPRRRFRRPLMILGLAGAAGATVWARGYAKAYGQQPSLSGFLTALRGPSEPWPPAAAAPPEDFPSDPPSSELERKDLPVEREPEPDADPAAAVNEEAAGPPPEWGWIQADDGSWGPAPLEGCGWPGCDWQSDRDSPPDGQRTAAAVHRNRCTFRPAGAVVPGS